MAKTLIVHGHGKWNLVDGYVQTPNGISIEFYTEGGKNQLTGFAYEYLLGSGLALTGGSADLVIGPFRQTQNYTLSALSQTQHDAALKYYKMGTLYENPDYQVIIMKPASKPKKLSLLLEFAQKKKFSKIVWMACRAVDLKRIGGRELGFNARQENRVVADHTLRDHISKIELDRMEAEFEAELKKLEQQV